MEKIIKRVVSDKERRRRDAQYKAFQAGAAAVSLVAQRNMAKIAQMLNLPDEIIREIREAGNDDEKVLSQYFQRRKRKH